MERLLRKDNDPNTQSIQDILRKARECRHRQPVHERNIKGTKEIKELGTPSIQDILKRAREGSVRQFINGRKIKEWKNDNKSDASSIPEILTRALEFRSRSSAFELVIYERKIKDHVAAMTVTEGSTLKCFLKGDKFVQHKEGADSNSADKDEGDDTVIGRTTQNDKERIKDHQTIDNDPVRDIGDREQKEKPTEKQDGSYCNHVVDDVDKHQVLKELTTKVELMSIMDQNPNRSDKKKMSGIAIQGGEMDWKVNPSDLDKIKKELSEEKDKKTLDYDEAKKWKSKQVEQVCGEVQTKDLDDKKKNTRDIHDVDTEDTKMSKCHNNKKQDNLDEFIENYVQEVLEHTKFALMEELITKSRMPRPIPGYETKKRHKSLAPSIQEILRRARECRHKPAISTDRTKIKEIENIMSQPDVQGIGEILKRTREFRKTEISDVAESQRWKIRKCEQIDREMQTKKAKDTKEIIGHLKDVDKKITISNIHHDDEADISERFLAETENIVSQPDVLSIREILKRARELRKTKIWNSAKSKTWKIRNCEKIDREMQTKKAKDTKEIIGHLKDVDKKITIYNIHTDDEADISERFLEESKMNHQPDSPSIQEILRRAQECRRKPPVSANERKIKGTKQNLQIIAPSIQDILRWARQCRRKPPLSSDGRKIKEKKRSHQPNPPSIQEILKRARESRHRPSVSNQSNKNRTRKETENISQSNVPSIQEILKRAREFRTKSASAHKRVINERKRKDHISATKTEDQNMQCGINSNTKCTGPSNCQTKGAEKNWSENKTKVKTDNQVEKEMTESHDAKTEIQDGSWPTNVGKEDTNILEFMINNNDTTKEKTSKIPQEICGQKELPDYYGRKNDDPGHDFDARSLQMEYAKRLDQYRLKLFGFKDNTNGERKPRKMPCSLISSAYESHMYRHTEIPKKKSWKDNLFNLLCVKTRN